MRFQEAALAQRLWPGLDVESRAHATGLPLQAAVRVTTGRPTRTRWPASSEGWQALDNPERQFVEH